jgi:pyrroloquinoline quinone (PQQ) biosynthesis protein C
MRSLKKHLLKHPFYEDWQKGIVTRSSLERMLPSIAALSRHFPTSSRRWQCGLGTN